MFDFLGIIDDFDLYCQLPEFSRHLCISWTMLQQHQCCCTPFWNGCPCCHFQCSDRIIFLYFYDTQFPVIYVSPFSWSILSFYILNILYRFSLGTDGCCSCSCGSHLQVVDGRMRILQQIFLPCMMLAGLVDSSFGMVSEDSVSSDFDLIPTENLTDRSNFPLSSPPSVFFNPLSHRDVFVCAS